MEYKRRNILNMAVVMLTIRIAFRFKLNNFLSICVLNFIKIIKGKCWSNIDKERVGVLSPSLIVICCDLLLTELSWGDYIFLYHWKHFFVLLSWKVIYISDLSLQASQKVISASPEDALKVLTDISQNFPTRARCLNTFYHITKLVFHVI